MTLDVDQMEFESSLRPSVKHLAVCNERFLVGLSAPPSLLVILDSYQVTQHFYCLDAFFVDQLARIYLQVCKYHFCNVEGYGCSLSSESYF